MLCVPSPAIEGLKLVPETPFPVKTPPEGLPINATESVLSH